MQSSSYRGSPKLEDLARFGSEKAGRLLLDMAVEKNISEQADYLRVLAGAIDARGDLLGRTNRDGTITIRWFGGRYWGQPATNSFSAELKKQLLDVLEAKLQPDANVETATLVCQLFSELGRRETAPALRRAMELPYAKVREIASHALTDMGETVPPVTRLDPVVFRLLGNGRPLTNMPVVCEVRMAGGRATSRNDVTDGEGLLRLEHDWFADTRYTVTNVVIIPERSRSTNLTWFEVKTPPPANLALAANLRGISAGSAMTLSSLNSAAVTDLRVTLAPVRVAIRTSAPEDFFRGEQMSLSLRVERDSGYGKHFDGTSSAVLRVPFTNQLVFPALQPGRYELKLLLPGAALWTGEFVVTERGATVEAALSRGADLRYEITTPGERSQFVAPQFEILRAGKLVQHYLHYDGSPDAWRSLPAGDYTFRVLSSDEATRQRRAANEIIPQPRGYRSAEVSFRITEASPKLIDLGVIALRPEN